jgi:hypothetical protein
MPKHSKRKNLADLFKDESEAVDGNIYRIAAAGGVTALEWHEKITFAAIVIIQALGPFFVLHANIKGFTNILWPFGGGDSTVGCNGVVGFVWQDNNESGVEFLGKKILGVCFILGFHLSSYRYLVGEAETERKIQKINIAGVETDYMVDWAEVNDDGSDMKKETSNPLYTPMLQFGQFMNVWSTVMCVMTLPYIFYGAEDAKSIVLDALSIAFLYSIDDVGGDLGGVDESRWNAPFVGTCASFLELNRQRYKKTNGGGLLSNDDDEDVLFAYPLDAPQPVPFELMKELQEWAEGGKPSEDVEYVISDLVMVNDNKSPQWLVEQMDAVDEAWVLPEIGAYFIAILTVWHSIMYLWLGNPTDANGLSCN